MHSLELTCIDELWMDISYIDVTDVHPKFSYTDVTDISDKGLGRTDRMLPPDVPDNPADKPACAGLGLPAAVSIHGPTSTKAGAQQLHKSPLTC